MPLYDYDCAACGRRIEVVHGVFAPGPTHCPNCGSGPLRKAITAAAVHYKGSGWAKKERRATVAPGGRSSGDGSSAASDGATSDGADSSTKTDTSDKSDKSDKAGDSKTGKPSGTSSKTSGAGTATKGE